MSQSVQVLSYLPERISHPNYAGITFNLNFLFPGPETLAHTREVGALGLEQLPVLLFKNRDRYCETRRTFSLAGDLRHQRPGHPADVRLRDDPARSRPGPNRQILVRAGTRRTRGCSPSRVASRWAAVGAWSVPTRAPSRGQGTSAGSRVAVRREILFGARMST